jgi:hypothetical protein
MLICLSSGAGSSGPERGSAATTSRAMYRLSTDDLPLAGPFGGASGHVIRCPSGGWRMRTMVTLLTAGPRHG